MNHEELERLLEQGFSGAPPRPEFREQVLRDSLAMLAHRRRGRVIWRTASLAAAAVVIAGVSFLLGRCTRPPAEVAATPPMPAAGKTEAVTVPSDVIAWLEAARLFRQLGMDDRMARAIDHAHKLLSDDGSIAGDATRSLVATCGGAVVPSGGCDHDGPAVAPFVTSDVGPPTKRASQPPDVPPSVSTVSCSRVLSLLEPPASPLSRESLKRVLVQSLGD
jgi:hypothetical protein